MHLRVEILIEAESSKDESRSFRTDVKSRRIDAGRQPVEPLPSVSESLIEARIDRLFGH